MGEQLFVKCPSCDGDGTAFDDDPNYPEERACPDPRCRPVHVVPFVVPVSPVRADREAVVEAIYAGQEAIERFVFQDSPDWYSASEMHAAYKAAERAWNRIMNAIRATPEPERAGETG